MRLRAKKHLEDRYQACADLVIDPPGRLRDAWSRGKPLHLEIGCGKGAFILGMAQKNPDIDFIAMERVKNVIISAMEKVRRQNSETYDFSAAAPSCFPKSLRRAKYSGSI